MSCSSDTPVPSAPSHRVHLEIAARTHVGRVREDNEDRLLVAHLGRSERTVGEFAGEADASRGGIVMAVCDGMGGEAGGEVAASCAVEALYAALSRFGPVVDSATLGRRIVDAMREASAKIQEIAAREPRLKGMGTTATVAGVVDERLVVAHVGDSRAYRLRGGRLERLTDDQTLVEMMIRQGQLTPEQAKSCAYGHVIIQALGATRAIEVDLRTYDLTVGDVLVVCSDGLCGVVDDGAMAEVLASSATVEEGAERLVACALQAGGTDNISCIVARLSGDGLPRRQSFGPA